MKEKTFSELRKEKSKKRGEKYTTAFLVTLSIVMILCMFAMILFIFFIPNFLAIPSLVLLAGSPIIGGLVVLALLAFDYVSDLISFHFPKDIKNNHEIGNSMAGITQTLQENPKTQDSTPDEKQVLNNVIIRKFSKTKVGHYMLSFFERLAGASEEMINARSELESIHKEL